MQDLLYNLIDLTCKYLLVYLKKKQIYRSKQPEPNHFCRPLFMGQVTLNGAKSVARVKNLNPFLMKLFLVHWFG